MYLLIYLFRSFKHKVNHYFWWFTLLCSFWHKMASVINEYLKKTRDMPSTKKIFLKSTKYISALISSSSSNSGSPVATSWVPGSSLGASQLSLPGAHSATWANRSAVCEGSWVRLGHNPEPYKQNGQHVIVREAIMWWCGAPPAGSSFGGDCWTWWTPRPWGSGTCWGLWRGARWWTPRTSLKLLMQVRMSQSPAKMKEKKKPIVWGLMLTLRFSDALCRCGWDQREKERSQGRSGHWKSRGVW